MGPIRRLLARVGSRPGEDRDAVWRRGFRVIKRNLRLSPGEIDLLCRDRGSGRFVLVEVKARLVDPGSNRRPEDAITDAKRRKLLVLAKSLMRDDRVRDAGLRIDVIAVEFARGRHPPVAVRHYERAVSSA